MSPEVEKAIIWAWNDFAYKNGYEEITAISKKRKMDIDFRMAFDKYFIARLPLYFQIIKETTDAKTFADFSRSGVLLRALYKKNMVNL